MPAFGKLTLRRKLPRLSSPLAIRLSRWSLPVILLFYVALVAVWALIVAISLHFVQRAPADFPELLRRALWSIWGPDNLLAPADQTFGYYVVAVANAIVSVLLPVFVLGAFVFKLFRHDPLTWRRHLTLEAHSSGNFALTARFYNEFNREVADISARAWIRWNPPANDTVFRNRKLKLLVRGETDDAPAWPLAEPAQPTTVRVLLCSTEEEPDPLRDDRILVQGEWVPRASATLVLLVTGTTTGVNEEFRSTKIYKLSPDADEIQEEIFQDITPGKPNQDEWKNYHGTQMMYLFMYGSLMRDADLRREGVEPKKAIQVRLQGWRRSWNVASDPAAKDRQYRRHADNSVYEGMVASLGLERHEGASACGIMAKVDYRLLAAFDAREQEYDRTDVTDAVVCDYGARPEGPFRVFAYVPKPQAVREYRRRRGNGDLAVRRGYYASIYDAAEVVGGDCLEDLDAANARLADDGVPIVDMDFEGSI